MATIEKCKCAVCGYEWPPRVEVPKACPRCKSHDWDGRLAAWTPEKVPGIRSRNHEEVQHGVSSETLLKKMKHLDKVSQKLSAESKI